LQYFADKNISPFNTGSAGDRIRNFAGAVGEGRGFVGGSGPFYCYAISGNQAGTGGTASAIIRIDFDPSRVVPTGVDNAPITLSVILWRRIN